MSVPKSRIQKTAGAFRSIGEVAGELGLESHVLRYWESKFPKQVKPVKRADGRRLFRPQDVDALRAIQLLVHQRGLTLKGAKALLAEQGVSAVLAGEARVVAAPVSGGAPAHPSPARALQQSVETAFTAQAHCNEVTTPSNSPGATARLEGMLQDISALKARLDAVRARSLG